MTNESPREHAPPRADGASTFVGRERERAWLRARLAAAERGTGGVALVSGEPGIGKTRLLRELAEEARARRFAVLWGTCFEGDRSPPYQPWVEALAAFARSIDPLWLRGELGPGAPLLAQLVPDLRAAVPPNLTAPAAGPFEHFLLYDAVLRLLRVAAEQQPLLIVLDDLHWADGDSPVLLRRVAQLTHEAPILLVPAYRREDLDERSAAGAALAALRREAGPDLLHLEGLPTEAVAAYLAAAGVPAGSTLAAGVARETGGNAFYVRELARHLLERGGLVLPDGGEGDWSVAALGVPEGVRDLLTQRLARLSPEANVVLRQASAFSAGVAFALLRSLSDLEDDALLDALDEALAAGLLVAVPGRREVYDFAHAIVRHATYDMLSPSRRVRLHRAIGAAMERVYAADIEPHVAELAQHYALGGDEAAVTYARRAGERARSLHAHAEAARLFGLALEAQGAGARDLREEGELLLLLGEAQNRTGDIEGAKPRFLRAGALARDLRAGGGDYRTSLLLARAALGYGGISEEMFADDTARLALLEEALAAVGGDDSALRARLLARLARVGYWKRPTEESLVLSAEALAVARRTADPVALGAALGARQYVLGDAAPVEVRHALTAEMTRLAECSADQDLLMTASRWRIAALLERGETEAADGELAAFADRAEELRQPFFLWWAAVCRAMRALLDGRFGEAERLIAAALAAGEPVEPWEARAVQIGQTFLLRWNTGDLGELEASFRYLVHHYPAIVATRCGLATILVETGRAAEGRALYEELAADGFASLRRGPYWLFDLASVARVCAAFGDGEGAGRLYDLLLPHDGLVVLNGLGRAVWGAVAHHLGVLAATVAAGTGDADRAAALWEGAAHHFQDAVALHERMQSPPWAARTRHEWATMLLARTRMQGDPVDRERATTLAEAALGTARDLGMTGLEHKTGALLAGLRDLERPARMSRPPSRPVYPAGLTAREVEILRLIAAGHTNREIADRLVLSVLTVQRHIANAYAKIGARGRAEAVAFALRHGLDGA